MNIEDTLNGGYNGLWGEVVQEDIYKIRDLKTGSLQENTHDRAFDFTPDIIFDLGANIGVFTRYARELYPKALIVAVEPDPENIKVFKEFTQDKTVLIEKGIGSGDLFHYKGANGSGEVYLSKNSAYKKHTGVKVEIQSIKLTELKKYIKKGMKVLCKVDIEGNETSIFDDPESMKFLLSFDYVTMELHYFSPTHLGVKDVKLSTRKALKKFEATHDTFYDHPMFYATKKK